MGNAVVEPAGEGVSVNNEPSGAEKKYIANSSINNLTVSNPNGTEAVTTFQNDPGTKKSGQKKPKQQVIETIDDEDTDETDPMEILFQFIPFYGQGDPSNDSVVRSTLSSLSVEEIDKRDQYGNTLLLLACQYRCEDLVRIMLNKGADPNAKNDSGASCLHFPCYSQTASKSIAKILLQSGANPEVSEHTYGCTPLHYAASSGDVDFCKMLLSYGANISTRDYYEYTCVDYAREAGMHEAAAFLQKKMLTTASQGPATFGTGQNGGALVFGKNDSNIAIPGMTCQNSYSNYNSIPKPRTAEEWISNVDPVSGSHYYLNTTTGECLWEEEYKKRISCDKKSETTANDDSKQDLLGGLRVETKKSSTNLNKLAHIPSLDATTMKKLLSEAKMQADKLLEDERVEFRSLISEKDGKIALLQSTLDNLKSEKEDLENTNRQIKERNERAQLNEGEASKMLQQSLDKLESENTDLKNELNLLRMQIEAEKQRYKSLESNLSNLESNQADKIAQEQQAANERAAIQQQREQEHIMELRRREEKLQELKAKMQADINKLKEEVAVNERIHSEKIDQTKSQYEKKIEELNKELSAIKAKAASELSNAQMLADASNKKAKEFEEQANAAIEAQKAMESEIIEAREVQKFNAQLHRDLQREQGLRKKLHNEIEDMKGKIRVYVRVRPMSNSERGKNCEEAVTRDGKMSVCVRGAQGPDSKKIYDFDQVFGGSFNEGNSQVDIFKDTKHLMLSVIDGYNVCIFAYGQTGSGKTFTMIGAADIGTCMTTSGEFDELAGITPRAVSEIFRLLNERSAQCTFEVEVQMFQLYRDGLDDLLADIKKKKDLDDEDIKKARHGGLKITLAEHSATGLVNVEGAVAQSAQSPADVMRIFAQGAARRATASTQMNAESSRSHLICSLTIKLTNRRSGTTVHGKLTLVDLAGSERVDKSGATGEMLKEAQSINKSLSALGDVIAALTAGDSHIPYRNHPLTMLMSDSIGGNAKTLMFVNCSPADYNVSETVSSLGFATRCKDVTNSGAAPSAVQVQQLNQLKKELAKLKKDKGKSNPTNTLLSRPG